MPIPSAEDFFLPAPLEELSQGDIVLAPSALLVDGDTEALSFDGFPNAPPLGEHVVVPAWDNYAGEGAPFTGIRARWSPAMVLSHDCEIDKEFNREVSRLVELGVAPEVAAETASDQWDLDRWILLAPVISYDEVSSDQVPGIRAGDRIGTFPLPPAPFFDNEEFLVDFSRTCTVDRRLIMKFRKLASLNGEAAGVLRYKLSEFFSSRHLALISEIETMVGRRIERTEVLAKSKKASALVLYLDDGSVVHLEVRKPRGQILTSFRRMLGRRSQDE